MSKFTPGPWEHYTAPNQVGGDNILGPLKHHTQSIARISRNPKEWEANARVIAAAPELYEALKQLIPITWNDGPLAKAYEARGKRAEQALAKVEGKEGER